MLLKGVSRWKSVKWERERRAEQRDSGGVSNWKLYQAYAAAIIQQVKCLFVAKFCGTKFDYSSVAAKCCNAIVREITKWALKFIRMKRIPSKKVSKKYMKRCQLDFGPIALKCSGVSVIWQGITGKKFPFGQHSQFLTQLQIFARRFVCWMQTLVPAAAAVVLCFRCRFPLTERNLNTHLNTSLPSLPV